MSDRTTVGQDDGATNNGQLAGPAPASDTKHLTDLAYVLPNLGSCLAYVCPALALLRRV